MDEYIERKKAIELIQPHVKPQTVYGEGYLQAIEHVTDILTLMPAADVQLAISGDNCIVCGRDVRKDNVYYDVNGGTICESCMNTKCKCKNGGDSK
jgi:hypothetical protein